MPTTYASAPHIRVPHWLKGCAWAQGPSWQDASALSGECGLSVLLLDTEAEAGTKLGASIRVWVEAERFQERASPALYVVARREEETDAEADDVLYRGDKEAAARQAIVVGLLWWAKRRCVHCRRLEAGAFCPAHARWARKARCTECSCQVLAVRDAAGRVWCDACGQVFMPVTRAEEAAADNSLWSGDGAGHARGIRILGGSTLYGQVSMGKGSRVRLATVKAAARGVRQVSRYIPSDTLVELVELVGR